MTLSTILPANRRIFARRCDGITKTIPEN